MALLATYIRISYLNQSIKGHLI